MLEVDKIGVTNVKEPPVAKSTPLRSGRRLLFVCQVVAHPYIDILHRYPGEHTGNGISQVKCRIYLGDCGPSEHRSQ